MILLDTHVWLWWLGQEKDQLKTQWTHTIEHAEQVAVSSISLFEVAWLAHRKRVVLSVPAETWFDKALGGSGIDLLPISPEIAVRAVSLHEHHSDPQDRIIIATAIMYGARVISADRKFSLYEELDDLLIN